MRQYVEIRGSAQISVDYQTPEGFRLGRWVNTQRVWRRSGRLQTDRADRLDELGFVWEPKPALERARERRDDQMLDWLDEFILEHGHADVPTSLVLRDGTNIGSWVRQVRREQVTGRIRRDLENALAKRDFDFAPLDAAFQVGLESLRHYVEEFGDTHVPSSFVAVDGYRLGVWFATTKARWRRGLLDHRKTSMLAELGVDGAHDPREATWLKHLEAFREWVFRNGHPRVPKDHRTEDGLRLGQWLAVQRNWFAQGRLKDERIRLLGEVDAGWFAMRTTRWNRESGVAAIGEAATMAYPLTINSYNGLRASGLDFPSVGRIFDLFGSWLDACAAAGVTAGSSTITWQTESLSDVEVLALLRHHLDQEEEADQLSYESWAAEIDGPSLSALLSRFGTWDEAAAKARSLADEVLDGT